MSFDNIASRLKKINAEKDAQTEDKEIDLRELYAIRAHMLGVLIRDARDASGFSMNELAERLGISDDELRDWEYGREVPSLPQVELVAYVLQVPISHFWGTETFAKRREERIIDGVEYTIVRNRMVGLLIKSAREATNASLEDVSERIGIHPDDIMRYEMGALPVPLTVLVSLSSVLNVSLNYFLEDNGRVGEFLELSEISETFEQLPEDVREFLAVPANAVYIRVAMVLADMPTENLRALAENLLDITL